MKRSLPYLVLMSAALVLGNVLMLTVAKRRREGRPLGDLRAISMTCFVIAIVNGIAFVAFTL